MNVITVDTASTEAPFEQVRRQIAEQVAAGSLPAGQKLPTVRQLATDLGLAANTVARAYRELESDGVIATHGRRGTFVHSDVVERDSNEQVHDAASTYVELARRVGLSLAEATRLIEAGWSR